MTGSMRFCSLADGSRIFRRSHPNKFFELPGKIMNGIIAQMICNLGKIHFAIPDQPFGSIDFHQGKIVDDPIARIVAENLLQKGTVNQVVLADLGNR